MSIKSSENQSFLFAKDIKNFDNFFQGYCFVGADYIFGDEGRQKYFDGKGIKINGGEDGCYVIAEKINKSYLFSTDFSGNKKIFYYWTPDIWVVSNSIVLIVEHLKKNNISLLANYSQLAAIGVHKGSFHNQLYSVNTFVKGIKLLPVNSRLEISDNGYFIENIKRIRYFHSYAEGLSVFISTWIARLVGLLNNKINIESDLTGGADSRTVFALLKKAAELSIDKQNVPKLRSGSTPTNTIDLEIATIISEIYDFPINKKESINSNSFSGKTSFLSWKTLCLGIYHPIYFPTSGPQHNIIAFGGAGAENHRPFYKYNDIKSFVIANASKISPKWLSYNVHAEIQAELNRMVNTGTKIDPMILHYREYRNRMHSGRTPQYKVCFNPLGSQILEDVSEIAGKNRMQLSQINYDLMATLLPSILEIPFDNEAKAFSNIRKANLTRLKEWHQIDPGNVYLDSNFEKHKREKTPTALELLNEEFHTAKNNQFVKDFFGTDFISQAEFSMKNAVEDRRFPHAINGQGVAAIIAGSLFD